MSAEPLHLTPEVVTGRLTTQERAQQLRDYAAMAFLARFKNRNTRDGYALSLRQWFQFCDDHFVDPLHAKRGDIEIYQRRLEEAGKAPSTIATKLNALAGYYRFACADEIIDKNPMLLVTRPQVERVSSTNGLSVRELSNILDAAQEHGSKQDYALMMILAYNGLRISEALQIDIESLESRKGLLVIRVRRKGGKWQDIPFAHDTAWAIKETIGDRTHGPLFLTSYGNRMDRTSAGRVVRRLCKQVGITRKITPHSFRHTAATLARAAGAKDSDIIDTFGWADGRQLEYYDRAKGTVERNVTHLLSAFVGRAS